MTDADYVARLEDVLLAAALSWAIRATKEDATPACAEACERLASSWALVRQERTYEERARRIDVLLARPKGESVTP
jgi:hypothetical protein